MVLELLICTHDERIRSVEHMLMPQHSSLRYLVAWQCKEDKRNSIALPKALEERPDVCVVRSQTTGLSSNRNVALAHAQGDILLLADDDCRYTTVQMEGILRIYEKHPDVCLITFQLDNNEGRPYKVYPRKAFAYPHVPKGFSACSCEISFRKGQQLPPFDVNFGIGSALFGCGEEEVWLHDYLTLNAGLGRRALFVPFTIGRTPSATTGTTFLKDASIQRAKGAVLRLLHSPLGTWLRIALTAFKQPVPLETKWNIWKEMAKGAKQLAKLRKL